jgi:23S rRNA (pseudouridine1915-N3)-methyltransferase
MRLVVAVVGKPRHAGIAEAIHDYETRAARYWPLEVHEVREERNTSVDVVRRREGERLLAALPDGTTVVLCDQDGERMGSKEFSAWLQREREAGRTVAFLVGGAFGHAELVRARSSRTISLAPWTLPHELARLVLAEQLYRAGTLVRGEPYHK